ncbi:MAG TPA: tetratricopeptide repeat protein, partial [Clostridia bacterium]|nr:tetratricopeptide repeat protein [Clostridia bacterium]
YLRSLGDIQGGSQSQEILKRAILQYEQIVGLDPKSVEDHLLLGRLYRLNNQGAKAEQEFKQAVQLEPNSEEAVTTLSYLYIEEGDTSRALAILEAVPEAERTARVYSALGFTYEQKKDYKNAIAAFQKAVEQDKDNLDAVRGLAQNLMSDGQIEAALAQYQMIAEADPQDAQSYQRMAEIYRRDGKFDQALESLKKAQAIVPDSLEVPYNMAVIYEGMGRFDEASQILQDLLKRSEKADGTYTTAERNNRAIFIERLGSIYRQQNKTQASVDAFRKMLPLGEENAVRAYQEMIETYRSAKQWQQATAIAQEAAQKMPNDRGLQMVLAGQEADTGKPDEAIARVRAMLKGTPEDREVWITLAQMYSRLRRWKEAEEAIGQALKLSTKPDEKSYTMFVAASMYERQKKYDQAEDYFRKILAEDQRNAMVLNYLGYMLADRGTRLEEALGYIRKAVQLDPQNGAYLDSLGWAYFKLGKYEDAEQALRKAVERMGTDPTVHDHLADLYLKTGRLKQAVAHWERALDEWKRTVPAEVEPSDVAKVQKKLESARVKLAKQAAAAK